MINATPFHYGRAILSYRPWHLKDTAETIIVGSQINNVQKSQRPHIFVDPAENEGGSMCLPFFHYNNWIDTAQLANFTEMGQLSLNSFDVLRHASGGTEPITISVFAWAEDVKMCLPTVSLSAQAGAGSTKQKKVKVGSQSGEYGKGIISKPASAIAEVAGALESVPWIGPFAMATRMGASTVSNIARLFGYSRPPILSTPSYYKPQYSTSLATCDSDETVQKFTTDSKQEITIDPRTVGLSGVDELSINSIASRETFLDSFTWTTTANPDVQLFSVLCAPMVERIQAPDVFFPTALSFVTLPFKAWSGTLKFRFQIVCSKFHHGRLQFIFEPTAASLATSGQFNTVYNEIIDIGETNDFEMEVAYTGDTPYKSTLWDPNGLHYFTDNTSLVNLPVNSTGTLTVRVLSELTAPINSADVTVNVFMSAGDDFEVANPDNTTLDRASYHPLIAQSGEGSTASSDHPESTQVISLVGASDTPSKHLKSQIFYGQSITTFRSLLRRYNKYRSWRTVIGGTDGAIIVNTNASQFKPKMRGFDADGIDLTLINTPYNYVNGSLLAYIMPAFVGYRGSMRVKLRDRGFEAVSMDVDRLNTLPDGVLENTTVNVLNMKPAHKSSLIARNMIKDGSCVSGTVLQPGRLAPYIEAERPFYTGKRFAFARNVSLVDSDDETNALHMICKVSYKVDNVSEIGALDEYRSVGEDFALFFFLNAPPRHEYPDPSPSILL
jgi:hypothetical protein